MNTKGKILIIEDDKIFRNTMVNLLSSEGYIADGAEDGYCALEMIKVNQVDLIIADVRLPSNIDGIETIKRIKESNPEVKVMAIVMTGYASDDAPERAKEVGAEDYICKPFDLDEFIHKCNNILDNRS